MVQNQISCLGFEGFAIYHHHHNVRGLCWVKHIHHNLSNSTNYLLGSKKLEQLIHNNSFNFTQLN